MKVLCRRVNFYEKNGNNVVPPFSSLELTYYSLLGIFGISAELEHLREIRTCRLTSPGAHPSFQGQRETSGVHTNMRRRERGSLIVKNTSTLIKGPVLQECSARTS